MIDFHTHTFFSDGVLSPAEHIRRAYVAGYKVLGITDHVDFSNIEFVYESIMRLVMEMDYKYNDMQIIPGVEITHVTASKIEKLVTKARDMGIPLVIMHGESPVEPVESGTNRAAIESCVDIVAHPGLISDDDVKRAAALGVRLEISGRKGHGITNGFVAKRAADFGASLVLDSDAHSDSDFLTTDYSNKILLGCGMEAAQIRLLYESASQLLEKISQKIHN